MLLFRRFLFIAALFTICPGFGSEPGTEPAGNLAGNGGFENGESGWMWQQWKGKPLPGYIDKEDMQEGLASFKLHEEGVEHGLHMAREVKIQSAEDHVLTVALKTEEMPDGAARVRVLVDGKGWIGSKTNRIELVKTGGTHDWQTFTVSLPASALDGAGKLTVFVYHDRAGQGTLGIDALSVKPGLPEGEVARAWPAVAEPSKATGKAASSSRAALPPGTLKGINYSPGSPVVLSSVKNARIAIQATPEKAFYRPDELPQITVQSVATPGATLDYRVLDGFGHVLLEKSAPADKAASISVALPPDHGYYEIVAALDKGGEALDEARRSIGVLTPPAEPVGDEPFGMWIQGMDHYPELGVRWTRDGVSWTSYNAKGEKYLEDRLEFYKWCRDNHIRILAYPKHPHPHQKPSQREVIEDTPEAWKAMEEWLTKIVQTLGGHVDAWGVINEPMRGHWKGDDQLIMRYWALMRKVVDQYDPGKPLVGPSLSTNNPAHVAQYQDLLDMGFGKHIDAIEMHTYITSPEEMDWEGNTQRILEMTKKATDKDLPIWSTEHGSSATYQTELIQARHLMRSWLMAKKIGYPVVIWHMFSHPQGKDTREIQFGLFRNVQNQAEAPPQPRPAGLAYGVMTRQLAGATYKTQLDYLGPSIHAYVFERGGKAMVALWTTSPKSYEVTLPVGEESDVTVTGIFGRVEPLEVRDGLIRVTVDRNPKFIAPLPSSYSRSEPIARVDKAIAVLPGGSIQTELTLVNPEAEPAKLSIEWLPAGGWRLELPQTEWSLEPNQSITVPLTATAPEGLPIGRYQIYAKVFLNGKYVSALTAEASILPQVTVAGLRPRFEDGRAVISGTLRRIDPELAEANIQLSQNRSPKVPVRFDGKNEKEFTVPVADPASDHLEDLEFVACGSEAKEQLRESLRLSFVPATHVKEAPGIDGDLSDWAGFGDGREMAVRWGWDERHLYLAVRVPDPTHIQAQPLVTQMWKDDSLQIGVAPNRMEQLVREFLPGLQEAEDVSFDVALRRDGPAMVRDRTVNKHLAPVGEVSQEQVRYAVRHADGMTAYELQIPVEQVGLEPLHGGEVLRAGLLVNANEGQGRKTTEWFGGIKDAKDPNLFGHLILTE